MHYLFIIFTLNLNQMNGHLSRGGILQMLVLDSKEQCGVLKKEFSRKVPNQSLLITFDGIMTGCECRPVSPE